MTHSSIISEATRRGLEHMVKGGELTAAEALAHRRIEIALTGKPGIALQAIEGIENRLEGRATQSIQITQTLDEDTIQRLMELGERLSTANIPLSALSANIPPQPQLQGEAKFLATTLDAEIADGTK
jgi:hypothetical protein